LRAEGNAYFLATIVALLSVGMFAFLIVPAVSAQGTATVSTINTNVANVNIASGASNPNNGLFYSPANITVVIGVNNTVVWTNHDSTNHTVVAVDNSYSDTLVPGGTFTHTFTSPGTYRYHCTIHTFMVGSVTVLGGPSSTSNTTSSSGGIPEFPIGAATVAVVTALILVSYVVVRQTKRG
jgi:plastocyanin